MEWDQDLTGVHLEIAKSTHSRIAVLAGPGTGKTTYGIMRRVARLLTEGVDPNKILLLSFTRTAAEDLKTKLTQQLAKGGIVSAELITASTLHSLAFKIIQNEGILDGANRESRILLKHEEKLMLHDLKRDGWEFSTCDRLLKEYEAGWATEVGSYPGPAGSRDQKEFIQRLFDWLTDRGALLMGEVIPIVNGFLRANPHNDFAGEYQHLIVDEFQDLNQLEQDTVFRLAGPNGNIMVVGDDDQSIYSWRHANPEGIVRFANHPDSEKHSITVCGRSPRNLVAVANNVRSHMPSATKDDLESLSILDGYVANVQWATLGAEVEGIAGAIVHRVTKSRVEPGDVLVLVNRTVIGKQLRDELIRQGVQAHTYFAQDALDTRDARRGLAIRRLINNVDAASWRVLLGLKSPKNGSQGDGDGYAGPMKRLKEMVDLYSQDEVAVLQRIIDGEQLQYSRHNLRSLVKNYVDASEALATVRGMTTAQAVDFVFPEGEPSTHDIREICLGLLSGGINDIDKLVSELVTRITQLDVPEVAKHVRIMTLHKSKGLTSKIVFVASLVNGIVPSMREGLTATERTRRDEEGRRLLYVAITRASEELVLSSFRRMPNNLAGSLMIPAKKESMGNARVQACKYFLEITGTLGNPSLGEEWITQYQEVFPCIEVGDGAETRLAGAV